MDDHPSPEALAQAWPSPGIDQLRSGDGSGVRARGAPSPHSGRDLAGGAGLHGGSGALVLRADRAGEEPADAVRDPQGGGGAGL